MIRDERAYPQNTDRTPSETYWSIFFFLWYDKPRENCTTGTALSNYYSTANRDHSWYCCWLQAAALYNTVPVAVWNNNMATPLWVRRWANPRIILSLDPQAPVLWKNGSTIIRDTVRYQLPLWPLGEVVFPLMNLQLGRIFKYRQQATQDALLGTEEWGHLSQEQVVLSVDLWLGLWNYRGILLCRYQAHQKWTALSEIRAEMK